MSKVGNREGKWVRRSRGEWLALLRRFDAKQDSATAFCVRESISEASFYLRRGLLRTLFTDPPIHLRNYAP